MLVLKYIFIIIFILYVWKEQERYCCASRSDNPPHIFAAADAAHQSLLHQRKHQAIVISGESGAGKTESANLLLKQLVYLAKVYYNIFHKYFISTKYLDYIYDEFNFRHRIEI